MCVICRLGLSAECLCSKTNPDLITDRQLYEAPPPAPRQTSPTTTQTTADKSVKLRSTKPGDRHGPPLQSSAVCAVIRYIRPRQRLCCFPFVNRRAKKGGPSVKARTYPDTNKDLLSKIPCREENVSLDIEAPGPSSTKQNLLIPK